MKKTVLFLLFSCVFLFFGALQGGAYSCGDVDADGKIASSDARLTLRASVYLE